MAQQALLSDLLKNINMISLNHWPSTLQADAWPSELSRQDIYLNTLVQNWAGPVDQIQRTEKIKNQMAEKKNHMTEK